MPHNVSFTSQVGQCELMAESLENSWIVRIHKDGRQELYLNLKRVEGIGPRSPLRTAVCKAADHLAADIVLYMNATDTAEGRKLFWKIQESVKQF